MINTPTFICILLALESPLLNIDQTLLVLQEGWNLIDNLKVAFSESCSGEQVCLFANNLLKSVCVHTHTNLAYPFGKGFCFHF